MAMLTCPLNIKHSLIGKMSKVYIAGLNTYVIIIILGSIVPSDTPIIRTFTISFNGYNTLAVEWSGGRMKVFVGSKRLEKVLDIMVALPVYVL